MKQSFGPRLHVNVCIVVLLVLSIAAPVRAVPSEAAPTAARAAPASLDWRPCEGEPAESRSRCAQIAVPIDWENPDSAQVNVQFARLSAAKPEQRIGVLFFNPGGPGGSAADIAAKPEFGEFFFPPQLRDRFDIVGIDPRGIGRSQQIRCSGAPHQPWVSRFPADANQATELERSNAQFGDSCIQGSGELARHLDTVSAAKDLDAVRRAR
ncbi:MAG: hypothetical protein ACRDPW_05945 [Mycobacteriales bacterium]